MWCSARVLDGDRCLPAYTSRRSVSGSDVRTEISVVRFCMERSAGTVMLNAGRKLVECLEWE